MIAKVSIGAGLRVSGSGSDDQATNQVGTRQESHDYPFAHHGETVHVLGADQVGDVGQSLVLREAQYRAGHRFLNQQSIRIAGALRMGLGPSAEVTALGSLGGSGD